MLFNIIYWIFGFLRMGTSGMTSQAYGKLGSAGNCPPADTFGGDRTCRGIMPYPAASSYQTSGFPDYPPHGRSQGNGNALLSYLHMGRSRHAGAIRTLRVAHRYAELPHSHVHSHYAEHCQHHASLSLVCFFGMKVEA